MPAPIALQMYSLREEAAKNYASVVRSVAAMGYAGVEPAGFPGTTAAEAGKLFRELGLSVPSAHTPIPVDEKKNEVLDIMSAIGCKNVVSGKGADDFKTPDLVKRTCELFNRAGAFCRENGLTFGVHNHWWEYIKVGDRYVYEMMLEFLDPGILFQLDTYWIKTAGVDPALMVKKFGKRAPTLHIKDGPCVKGEPMTAVGKGIMDFPSVIGAGKDSAEWLIVEIDRCATDMTEAVRDSLDFLVKSGLGRGKTSL